jgi:RNA polymerase sigma-70 factor (ECF subfamily)
MVQALTEPRLREWMDTMGPRLIHLSLSVCRDRHKAEEIVQDAFVKLWSQPPDAGEPVFKSWLHRVVVNASINALRPRRPSELPDECVERSGAQRPQDRCMETETVEMMRDALDRLDDEKRVILLLRGIEKLSYQEISEALAVPIGTVMSRLNRARRALAEELKTHTETYDIRKYLTA